MSEAQLTQYEDINDLLSKNTGYKEGFVTTTAVETFEKGLNEEVVRAISAKKNEPEWMLDFRLKAFAYWKEQEEPHWAKMEYTPLDYQDYSYYSAPECGSCAGECSTDESAEEEIDPEVAKAFAALGVPLTGDDSNVAVDAIFDSISVSTTKREELEKIGVIFCSFSEAVQDYPELVKKYIGSVVPY
ncbi:MAG: Fe-S cluster assembly protein SufB, partial [Pseudomonadota bacterium]|nr:Fe-S cluster assembly protein SufB [Pseudomonadota bacterium]